MCQYFTPLNAEMLQLILGIKGYQIKAGGRSFEALTRSVKYCKNCKTVVSQHWPDNYTCCQYLPMDVSICFQHISTLCIETQDSSTMWDGSSANCWSLRFLKNHVGPRNTDALCLIVFRFTRSWRYAPSSLCCCCTFLLHSAAAAGCQSGSTWKDDVSATFRTHDSWHIKQTATSNNIGGHCLSEKCVERWWRALSLAGSFTFKNLARAIKDASCWKRMQDSLNWRQDAGVPTQHSIMCRESCRDWALQFGLFLTTSCFLWEQQDQKYFGLTRLCSVPLRLCGCFFNQKVRHSILPTNYKLPTWPSWQTWDIRNVPAAKTCFAHSTNSLAPYVANPPAFRRRAQSAE